MEMTVRKGMWSFTTTGRGEKSTEQREGGSRKTRGQIAVAQQHSLAECSAWHGQLLLGGLRSGAIRPLADTAGHGAAFPCPGQSLRHSFCQDEFNTSAEFLPQDTP